MGRVDSVSFFYIIGWKFQISRRLHITAKHINMSLFVCLALSRVTVTVYIWSIYAVRLLETALQVKHQFNTDGT